MHGKNIKNIKRKLEAEAKNKHESVRERNVQCKKAKRAVDHSVRQYGGLIT